jgi:predicted Zn-dependent peptidase
MLNRTIAPIIKEPVDFKIELAPCEKTVLKNGVEVYSVNMGTEETLQISWVFYAGNWYEDKKIQAAATNHLLKNGTRTKNAFEINEHFEYYGAYMNRSCYTETSDITLHCLNKHIDKLLPVVA